MNNINEGLVQVYTGDGKGKTTAALGLGMRAAGNDFKVIMVQFLKGDFTGELNSVKKLQPNFQIIRFEKKRGFFWTLTEEEKLELKKEIENAFGFCIEVEKENKCDVLILDEIMGVLINKLLTEEDIIKLIDLKPRNMELVLTGRNVPERILERADLVTEMKAVKHYFNKGISARKGIEY